jgi:hypothetical protein
MPEQLAQLRKLPDCYSQLEAPFVERAIEAYLAAQLSYVTAQIALRH